MLIMTSIASRRTLGKKSLPESILKRRLVLGTLKALNPLKLMRKIIEVNGIARMIADLLSIQKSHQS